MRSPAVLTLFIAALSLLGCAPRSVVTADKNPVPEAAVERALANVPDSFRRGEKLFRKYGCRACHGFDEFFGKCPDLAGATMRSSPKWIRDWLTDPEKMRQTDSYARDLSARFEAVMPNLGLKDSEIDDLLIYLKAEGSASRAAQP